MKKYKEGDPMNGFDLIKENMWKQKAKKKKTLKLNCSRLAAPLLRYPLGESPIERGITHWV
jgi:hypothetical protein